MSFDQEPGEEKPDLSFVQQEALDRQKEWEGDLTELQRAFYERWTHGKEAELPPLSMLKNLETAIEKGTNISHWLYEIVSFNPDKAYPLMESLADTGNWQALEALNTMTSNHEWGLVTTEEDRNRAKEINNMIRVQYEELIKSKPSAADIIKDKMEGIKKKIGL